ncbi:DNA polymerase III epsilon subunit [Burkholderia phage vB_BglM_WTB]
MYFTLFDTETTGLPYHEKAPLRLQPRIIEFGGLVTDGEQILDTFEFVCNPGIEIEPIITKITGLTNEDLAGKEFFSSYVEGLADFFGYSPCGSPVPQLVRVAHNLSFDRHMLEYDLARIDLTLDAIGFDRPNCDGPKALMLCTVEQTMHQYGRRMKLEELYNELVGEYEQTHRALDDVKLMHEVCKRLGIYELIKESAQ